MNIHASESCALEKTQRKEVLFWSLVSLTHQGKSFRGWRHLLSEPQMNLKGSLRAQQPGPSFGSFRLPCVAAKPTKVLNSTLQVESWDVLPCSEALLLGAIIEMWGAAQN